MHRFRLIQPFLKENKNILLIYLFFSFLSYPLESIIIPNIFGSFISEIKNNVNNYKLYFLKAIFFSIIINLSYSIIAYLDSIIIPTFNEYIVNHIYSKLLLNYQNSYTDLELGRIISRLNMLPGVIRELTTDLFNWIVTRLLTVIVVNIYLLYLNPMLGSISMLLLLILIVFNFKNYGKCIEMATNKYKIYENRAEETQDKLSNLFAIYSSANINKEIESYKQINKDYKDKYIKSIACSSKLKFGNNFIQCLMFLILNGFIVYLYKINKLTFAKMISANMIVSYYLPCISNIMTTVPDYANHIGVLNALDDFIKMLDKDEKQKPDIKISNAHISIKNLKFGYNNNILFNDFNLDIKSTQKIGLLGESGNGKSTLIKLIMGYFPVPNNSIFIDGQDINNYNLENLRSQITYINQSTKLFSNTVYYNIKYGNDMEIKDIDILINRFNLNSLFENLENGFNSMVGVNGDKLSGGQKQIIQILRAFGKPSKIIILDEPTASVDPTHKEIILNIINELSINKTLILVTHDMDNIKIVDRVIKLSHGKIISDTIK